MRCTTPLQTPRALPAAKPAPCPTCPRSCARIRRTRERVEEPVHHLLDDTGVAERITWKAVLRSYPLWEKTRVPCRYSRG
jgi:hypothetical protein